MDEVFNIIFRNRLKHGIDTRIRVQGYSMIPLFRPGDVVCIGKYEGSSNIGDIILFYVGPQLVIHRIVGRKSEAFLTKGDANTWFDDPVNKTRVIGVYRCEKEAYALMFTVVGLLSRIHGALHFFLTNHSRSGSLYRIISIVAVIVRKMIASLDQLARHLCVNPRDLQVSKLEQESHEHNSESTRKIY